MPRPISGLQELFVYKQDPTPISIYSQHASSANNHHQLGNLRGRTDLKPATTESNLAQNRGISVMWHRRITSDDRHRRDTESLLTVSLISVEEKLRSPSKLGNSVEVSIKPSPPFTIFRRSGHLDPMNSIRNFLQDSSLWNSKT